MPSRLQNSGFPEKYFAFISSKQSKQNVAGVGPLMECASVFRIIGFSLCLEQWPKLSWNSSEVCSAVLKRQTQQRLLLYETWKPWFEQNRQLPSGYVGSLSGFEMIANKQYSHKCLSGLSLVTYDRTTGNSKVCANL